MCDLLRAAARPALTLASRVALCLTTSIQDDPLYTYCISKRKAHNKQDNNIAKGTTLSNKSSLSITRESFDGLEMKHYNDRTMVQKNNLL